MAPRTLQRLADRFDQTVFDAIYSRALVYNTCWEDPAVDRLALSIGSDDTMLVITSAGCNVLDYALTGPQRVHAVDASPRQNALLELKLAGIRRLAFDDFFAAFGSGYHPHFREVYRDALREDLLPFAQKFWDKRVGWFGNPRGSFYNHGLSGIVARLFRVYLRMRPQLAASIAELFDTRSLDDQRRIYDTRVQPLIWTRMSSYYPEALAEEWSYILRRATPDARIIFRSAHAAPTYLERLELGAERMRLSDDLIFHRGLAADLQRLDRVHTYAGFHVADVTA